MEIKETSFTKNGIDENVSEDEVSLFDNVKHIIYQYMTRNSHDYTPELGEFRASSFGKCSRKILLDKTPDRYLSREEIELLPESYHQEKLGREHQKIEFGAHIAGQVIHEAIQEALSGEIISMEEEVELKIKEARLVGHYDLLMKLETGEEIVIDIKSTSNQRIYLPKEAHLKQLMAYQGMMGGIRGALLYVNRNNWEMSYISQPFSKDEYSKTLVKLSILFNSEDRQKLPPPVPESDYECISTYHKCHYYDYCFPNPNFQSKEE